MNATALSRALRVFRPLSARLFSQSNGTELLGHASTCIRQEPSAKAGLDDSGFTGHIPLEDLKISYSYSGGAGGQHVNKTKSKVEIRFHVPSASWIPSKYRPRFMEKEANRITKDGFFVISSEKTRKQLLNQADCLERIRRTLRECIQSAAVPTPDPETVKVHQAREAFRNEQRLREKKTLSSTKSSRQKPTIYDL